MVSSIRFLIDCGKINIKNYVLLSSACSWGYSYEEQGTIINGDNPANNAQQCLNQCNEIQQCKFWDFGNNQCRLYSGDGNGPKPDEHYEFGAKNCVFGMFTVILLLPNIYFNDIMFLINMYS